MRTKNFAHITRVSSALWADEPTSLEKTTSTLGAVSLLNLGEDRSIDRVCSGLVKQALHAGPKANQNYLNVPFYRLDPEERFILVALHENHWSYARLQAILGLETPSALEELAWRARERLLSLSDLNHGMFPSGPSSHQLSCPTFDSRKPWTQRFLDEELGTLELSFLQTHLLSCGSCKETLARARKFYYQVDTLIPRPKTEQHLEKEARRLLKSWNQWDRIRNSSAHLFWMSLRSFFSKRDVQILAAIVAIVYLFQKFF